MQFKPLLAIAALAVTLTGCTPPPSGTSAPQTAQSTVTPRVQLDLQGLGKGTISASRLTETAKIFEIERDSLNNYLLFVVPQGAEQPDDTYVVWYFNDADDDGVFTAAETTSHEPVEYTHLAYRFSALRDEKLPWMQVRFQAEGYAADSLLAAGGTTLTTLHRYDETEASRVATPFLRLAPDAPATLRFAARNSNTGVFETYETLDVAEKLGYAYETLDVYRLELDLSLTTQDDKPLLGLNQDYLDLRRFDISPYSYGDPHLHLDLTEVGNGAYTLGIAFRRHAIPTAVDVALTLKTPPLSHDVEY